MEATLDCAEVVLWPEGDEQYMGASFQKRILLYSGSWSVLTNTVSNMREYFSNRYSPALQTCRVTKS
jgi:hypothetical protein